MEVEDTIQEYLQSKVLSSNLTDNDIDNNALYHCGASFKDLGKKCFAITKVEELTILENLMKKL